MNKALKEQLEKFGFQQTPQKERKMSREEWKKIVRLRLNNSNDMLSELQIIIGETHDYFKEMDGSGKWFRKFLRPLYELKNSLEENGDPTTIQQKKKLMKRLW